MPPQSVRSTRATSEESYCLPFEIVQKQLRDLMDQHPPISDGRYACYLITGSGRYSGIPRTVECAVFQEFFDNSPAVMNEAYAPYEAHSHFFLVVDCGTREPSGCLRVATHSEAGFKTLNDIARPPLAIPARTVMNRHGIDKPETCWDVGTLAVLKKYRGHGHAVSTMLYGQFYAAARKAGVEHAVAILDEHAYSQLTETFAVPFIPIVDTQPFDYLGSERSRAAYLHLPAVVPAVEATMAALDAGLRELLKPNLSRVIYAEGLPEVVLVSQ